MKWLLELITGLFRGQQGENRADFDSVSKQWESLSMVMNTRMNEAFTRMDKMQIDLNDVTDKEKECKKRLAVVEIKLAKIELKTSTEPRQ